MPVLGNIPTLPLLDKVVLTVAEACAISGFRQMTIYDAIADGSLPARKRPGGRRFIVLRKDLDAWLEAMPKASCKENVVSL
jgi:excisionase family DNA binding protein